MRAFYGNLRTGKAGAFTLGVGILLWWLGNSAAWAFNSNLPNSPASYRPDVSFTSR